MIQRIKPTSSQLKSYLKVKMPWMQIKRMLRKLKWILLWKTNKLRRKMKDKKGS